MNVKDQMLHTSLMTKKHVKNVLMVVTNVLTELFVKLVMINLYSIATFVLLNALTLWNLLFKILIMNVSVKMTSKLLVANVLNVLKVVLCVTLMLFVNIVILNYGWLLMVLVPEIVLQVIILINGRTILLIMSNTMIP